MSDVKLDHSVIDEANKSFAKVIKTLTEISEGTKSKDIHVQAMNAIESIKGSQRVVANCINDEIRFEKERLAEVEAKKLENKKLEESK